MKISTRVDSIGGEHVHFSLFMNGKAGDLCLKIHEYERFKIILEQGATMVERQEVSIEPPLNEEERLALDNIRFCVDTKYGIPALPNSEDGREALLESLCILFPRLWSLTHEDHPDATKDDTSPRSNQPSAPRSDGADAQQLQGNRNDQLPNRDREEPKSPNSRGVGEGSGGTPSVPSGSKIPSFF